MTDKLVAKKRVSLAEHAVSMEALCNEIDDNEDDELPAGLIERFMSAQVGLSTKVDSWIGYLDAAKARILLLEEMKARVKKAIRSAKTVNEGMKGYIEHVLRSTGEKVTLKGSTGTLYLHGQAPSLKLTVKTSEKTVYNVIDPTMPDFEQSMVPYCQQVTFLSLDRDKLVAELKAGMKLPWASLEPGAHVRIKG